MYRVPTIFFEGGYCEQWKTLFVLLTRLILHHVRVCEEMNISREN
jgi:hypothetical protein